MKFSENNALTIPEIPKVFVYFLLYENEVVYVGKTQQGIVRPFSHHDKKFDKIKIVVVDERFLSISEEYFITKYRPVYNLDLKEFISLERSRNIIRHYANDSRFSVRDLKAWLVRLGFVKNIFKPTENCIRSSAFWLVFQHICNENKAELPDFMKLKQTTERGFL